MDRLSGGRAVMSVGLGAIHEGWTAFEADEGRRARAAKLDECLAVYDGLMRGQPFAYDGKYYSVKPTDHLVSEPPAQRPRPPVWVVGAKVSGRAAQPSLARAARWDGLLPAFYDDAAGRGRAGPTSSRPSSPRYSGCGRRQGWPVPLTTSSSRRIAPASPCGSTRPGRRRGRRPGPPGG
ncbi:MAG TPA: LLM class flavin-dependent oxidoreductase [Trebonia sp.]